MSTDTDGTICIWDVETDPQTQRPLDPYFAEILINTQELNDKNLNLKHLTCRIVEMTTEHSFEIKQRESMYSERIKELEDKYTNHVKTLKTRIKVNLKYLN